MICLGIESTAHTFGIGIIDGKGKTLANESDMYRPKKGWGIIPIDSAKHHEEIAEKMLQTALNKSGLEMKDINMISYSRGPGLPPCLHKGLNFARKWAKEYRKPLVGVNHLVAHVEIGRLSSGFKNPVAVLTTGANTQILSFSEGRYRCFGECMDIGMGNALDKFGRGAGLDFPAGPKIEELAKKGRWIELPYVVKGMDLSFSGIVTEAIKKFKQGEKLEDVCYSIQEVFFSMLTEVTERALAHLGKDEVLLIGGVAANRRAQEMMRIMCRERKARFSVVPKEYSGDNGLMIAWTGILDRKNKSPAGKADIDPRWRTDEVDIGWI